MLKTLLFLRFFIDLSKNSQKTYDFSYFSAKFTGGGAGTMRIRRLGEKVAKRRESGEAPSPISAYTCITGAGDKNTELGGVRHNSSPLKLSTARTPIAKAIWGIKLSELNIL